MYLMIDACMGKNEMLSLAESVSLAEMQTAYCNHIFTFY